jgi:uncharacterized protein (TIGR00661 family)
VNWLTQTRSHHFFIYCDTPRKRDKGHIHLRPLSRERFQKDLADCSGVISNAGFGLSSEAIQCGKKLLVKPLKGQLEQLSNAKALQQLNIGDVIHRYDNKHLHSWLEKDNPQPVTYPDVAKALVNWIKAECKEDPTDLATRLWRHPNLTRLNAKLPN